LGTCLHLNEKGGGQMVTIIQPEDWNSSLTGYYSIDVDDQPFEYQGGAKDYALSVPREGAIRFELHDGDQAPWDVANNHASERVEIADRQAITYGTPLEVSYDFMLEPGQPNTAYFLVLGQLHQNVHEGALVVPPPFSVTLTGEKMGISIGFSDANGNPVQQVIFTDAYDIQRGHDYDMDIKATFDPDGNGRLVVTRDGVTIVDYMGPLGYIQDQGVYWAEGIYRHSNATETIAAVYGDLDIETGSTVNFPNPDAYIGAPTVVMNDAAHDPSGASSVTISGTAKLGTTVLIYENGKVVATAATDGLGRYTTNIIFSTTGEHSLSAIAVDSSGRYGITAAPAGIEIGTAAEIVGRMDNIMTDASVQSIILTDTHMLTVPSDYVMRLYINSGVLNKIAGGDVTFKTSTAVSGGSYDRQVYIYNEQGKVIESERYLGSKLVFDQKIGADGINTVQAWKTDGSSDINITKSGVLIHYEQYDSLNRLKFDQTFNDDGSRKTVTYFNPETGAKTSETLYHDDKSYTRTTYGIIGKDYVEEAYTYDATGKLVLQERFAAGHVKTLSTSWEPDGTTETHRYSSTGQETSFSIIHADKSHVEGTFGITGHSYSGQIISYNASNTMVSKDLLDESGRLISAETFGTSPALKVFAYANGTGPATGYTLYAADHSYDVAAYVAGTTTVARISHYDATGNLIGTDILVPDSSLGTYNPVTNTYYQEIQNSDGSREAHRYDADTGKELSYSIRNADGSRVEANLAITGKEYTEQIISYDSQGKVIDLVRKYGDTAHTIAHTEHFDSTGAGEIRNFDMTGQLTTALFYAAGQKLIKTETYALDAHLKEFTAYNADGSKETHRFDPATGHETGYSIRYPDGGRVEAALAITGRDYTQQIQTYDAAGKLIDSVRKYGDAAHTISQSYHFNTDGSQDSSNFDIKGRQTVSDTTHADHSRDYILFTYAGDGASPSTIEQSHYGIDGRKQWTDKTNVDGSHTQTAFAAGVVLTSHEAVKDTLVSSSIASDTFLFHSQVGQDTISGFQAHGGDIHDRVAFDSSLVDDYASLHTLMSSTAAGTLITFDDHNSVLISKVAMTNLSSEDFLFV